MPHLDQLHELEAKVAAAAGTQQRLRRDHEGAVREVKARYEDHVRALEANLEGSAGATAAEKAYRDAVRRADEPWQARIDAAGRLVEQAKQRRLEFIREHFAELQGELAEPARDWPERARKALEAAHALAREYDQLKGPLEALGQEIGQRPQIPRNPLDGHLQELKRIARTPLHGPVPFTAPVFRIPATDEPDPDVREAARARFIEGEAA